MAILSFLNPRKVIESVQTIYQDTSNYLFYRKKISILEKEGIFQSLNMRSDWLKRVYYVINLEPETMLATGDLIELEKSRVYESVYKFQGRFADHNLVEIVDITTQRIKDSDFYAYLVMVKYRTSVKSGDFYNAICASVVVAYLVKFAIYLYMNQADVLQSIGEILNRK